MSHFLCINTEAETLLSTTVNMFIVSHLFHIARVVSCLVWLGPAAVPRLLQHHIKSSVMLGWYFLQGWGLSAQLPLLPPLPCTLLFSSVLSRHGGEVGFSRRKMSAKELDKRQQNGRTKNFFD